MVVSYSMGCGDHSAAPAQCAAPSAEKAMGGWYWRSSICGGHQEPESAGLGGGSVFTRRQASLQGAKPHRCWVDVAMAGETTHGRGRVEQDMGVGEKHRQFGFGVVSVSLHGIGSWKKRLQNKKQFLLLEEDEKWGVFQRHAKTVICRGPGHFDRCRRSRRFQVSFDHQLDHDARPPPAQHSFSPRRIDSKPISARLWTERIQTCCLRERWRATRRGSTEAEVPKTKTTRASRRRRISRRHSGHRP